VCHSSSFSVLNPEFRGEWNQRKANGKAVAHVKIAIAWRNRTTEGRFFLRIQTPARTRADILVPI
jgi:hypothetical protein